MIPAAIAVIGAGRRGLAHIRTLAALGAGPVTVVDHHPDRRDEAQAAGATGAAVDLAAAARRCRPDLVVVATPAADHVDSVLAAVDLGAAVVVEKPVAVDAAGLAALAAVAPDRFVGAGHAERWHPAVVALRLAIDPAALDRAAFERRGPAPAAADDLGCDLDLAVHDLDLAAHLLGPVTVAARHAEPDDGPAASCTWLGTAGTTALSVTTAWAADRRRMLTLARRDGGRAHADLVEGRAWTTDATGTPQPLPVGTTPSLTGFWTATLTALRDGQPPPVPVADGAMAVRLALGDPSYHARRARP